MFGADCHHVDSLWTETRGNLLVGDALCLRCLMHLVCHIGFGIGLLPHWKLP